MRSLLDNPAEAIPEPAELLGVAGSATRRTSRRQTDIVIVGGGLAGSAAAAMLGRTDHDVVLVDPHEVYPPDFRCEKLDPSQFGLMRRLGFGAVIERAATPCRQLWIARGGRLIDKMPIRQHGILYHDLVAAIRGARAPHVPLLRATATSIATGVDRQLVELSTGETIEARLVVLANGLSARLRRSLGMTSRLVSAVHCVTIGFDVSRLDGGDFGFDALTFHPERPSDQTAYLTLFKVGSRMRANLMTYRPLDDPWFQDFQKTPEIAISRLMPGLAKVTGAFGISSMTKPRPTDLCQSDDVRRPGIVLIGDVFATSCPAAGTGTSKIFTDVERLCAVHIPRWLASEGMGSEKIASFYDDPCKRAVDRHSIVSARTLRLASTDRRLYWRFSRFVRFASRFGKGAVRSLMARGRTGPRRYARQNEQ